MMAEAEGGGLVSANSAEESVVTVHAHHLRTFTPRVDRTGAPDDAEALLRTLRGCFERAAAMSLSPAQATAVKDIADRLGALGTTGKGDLKLQSTGVPDDLEDAAEWSVHTKAKAYVLQEHPREATTLFSPEPHTRLEAVASTATFLVFHIGFILLNLLPLHYSKLGASPLGMISLNICFVHAGILVGVIGATTEKTVRLLGLTVTWWTPPSHIPGVIDALTQVVLMSGHFFGCGVIAFQTQIKPCIACDEDGVDCSVTLPEGCFNDALFPDAGPQQFWTVIDALYFCVVLISTVGYGANFVPQRAAGRLFVIFYTMAGVLIFGTISKAIGTIFLSSRKLFARLLTWFGNTAKRWVSSSTNSSLNSMAHHAAHSDLKAKRKTRPSDELFFQHTIQLSMVVIAFNYVRRLPLVPAPGPACSHVRCPPGAVPPGVAVCITQNARGRSPACAAQVSALVFMLVEKDWRFFDAVYHSLMTATTVGLGEYAPTSQRGRMFAIFHILMSVVLFANLIGALTKVRPKCSFYKMRGQLLAGKIDMKLTLAIAARDDAISEDVRIDRSAFVLAMLIQLGRAQKADVKEFLEMFDQIDTPHLGSIHRDDILSYERTHGTRIQPSSSFLDTVFAPARLAKRLQFPASLAMLNFVWDTYFTYLLLLSGVLNFFLIQQLKDHMPTPARHLIAACLALVSAGIKGVALTFFALWCPLTIGGSELYYKMDQTALEFSVVGPSIDPQTSLLMRISKSDDLIRGLSLHYYNTLLDNWPGIINIIFFTTMVSYISFIDIWLFVRCIRARRTLLAANAENLAQVRVYMAWDQERMGHIRSKYHLPRQSALHSSPIWKELSKFVNSDEELFRDAAHN